MGPTTHGDATTTGEDQKTTKETISKKSRGRQSKYGAKKMPDIPAVQQFLEEENIFASDDANFDSHDGQLCISSQINDLNQDKQDSPDSRSSPKAPPSDATGATNKKPRRSLSSGEPQNKKDQSEANGDKDEGSSMVLAVASNASSKPAATRPLRVVAKLGTPNSPSVASQSDRYSNRLLTVLLASGDWLARFLCPNLERPPSMGQMIRLLMNDQQLCNRFWITGLLTMKSQGSDNLKCRDDKGNYGCVIVFTPEDPKLGDDLERVAKWGRNLARLLTNLNKDTRYKTKWRHVPMEQLSEKPVLADFVTFDEVFRVMDTSFSTLSSLKSVMEDDDYVKMHFGQDRSPRARQFYCDKFSAQLDLPQQAFVDQSNFDVEGFEDMD